MSRTAVVNVYIAIIVIAIACFGLALRNYSECRRSGFSRLYCASTHLVN